MLPALVDTLRACALSRFTDVKAVRNSNYKTCNATRFDVQLVGSVVL